MGVVGGGEAEGDVEVAVRVRLRTEGILVVAAIAPGIGDDVEAVGAAVAVAVAEAGQLAALGDEQVVVLPREAEDLVEAAGVEVELGLGLRVVEPGNEPDVAVARSGSDAAVGKLLEGPDLEDDVLGDRDLGEPVVGPLGVGRAPALRPPPRR